MTIPFYLIVLFFVCLDIWAVSIEMRMSVMKERLEIAKIVESTLAREIVRIKEEVEENDVVSSGTESGMCTRSDTERTAIDK